MPVMLLRHTQPKVAAGICYGQTDLEVSGRFDADAARIVSELPAFDLLVSSPLQRCRLLADAISDSCGLSVQIDERVQEIDFGSWEGVAWSDIPRTEIDAWASSFMHARPHGGESVAMLHERTQSALADYRKRGQRTVIVTHAGFIKAALATGSTATDFSSEVAFGRFVELEPF